MGLGQPIMGTDVIRTGFEIRTFLAHHTPLQGSLVRYTPPPLLEFHPVTSNSTVSKWGSPRFPLTCRMLLLQSETTLQVLDRVVLGIRALEKEVLVG